MNLDDYESNPPPYILERIATLLREDGFCQSIRALFVRNHDKDWRAWFVVPGFPTPLFPAVGVYNDALVQIAQTARANLGRPSQQPPKSGPPLIMVNLDRLIGDDPDCQKRITWHYQPEERHKFDPGSIPELAPSVADDLVYCLRKKAYPFFAAHMTFESIWDAVRNRMGSPAFQNYLPIILIKQGRRSDIPRLLEEESRRLSKRPNLLKNYKEYVEELLRLMPE